MSIKIQNILKLLSVAIIGGLCAFTWSVLVSLFLPQALNASIAFNFAPAILAMLGAIVSLIFLKSPKRIPVFLFFVGFIFINKLFEGIIVTIFAK